MRVKTGASTRHSPALLSFAVAVVLFTLLAFCSTSDTIAFADDVNPSQNKRVVRVAYFEDGDYMSVDGAGEYRGYNIDYLDEIARYANWSYEYLNFNGFESAEAALEAGEVDLLPMVYQTEERTERMLFSDAPVCEMYTTLNVRVDDTRYAFENFEAFSGMKVGVISESQDAQAFIDYSKQNSFEVQVVPYEATEDLLGALDNGTLDAVAITYLGANSRFRTVAQFAPEPLYFAFSPTQEEMLGEFDTALNRLKLRDPDFATLLYDRYFGINTDQDPVFTEDEYAYLASAPTLRVAYSENRAPLSYTDPETGEFAGVTARLFEDIEHVTGLKFDFIPAGQQSDVIDLVMRGDADIAYGVDHNVIKNTGKEVLTTGAYLRDPMALVVGSNSGGSRIALPESFVPANGELNTADSEITYYNTPKACFDAVLEERADVAYVDTHVANYLLSEQQYAPLSVTTITSLSNDMSIGVAANADPRLLSILDRCVQYTSENKMNTWLSQSSLVVHQTSLIDFIRQYPVEIIVALIVLFGILLGVALYLGNVRLKTARRIEELSFVDSLTGGWSLAKFRTEVGGQLASAKDGEYAILYLDIKRFKSFNAAFGYAAGDDLLKSLSNTLGHLSSPGEHYAHITADEFVALIRWNGWDDFMETFNELDRLFNELPVLTSLSHRLSLHAGVCVVSRDKGDRRSSHETIVEYMDCARYARDSIGESSHSVAALYTADMMEHDIAERALVAQAHDALDRGEFVAYYQPKVELATNRIIGFEALARWESRDRGLVQPNEFIPLFEKTGLVKELDLQLFRQACARIRSQLDKNGSPLPIACNFSRLHLLNDTFPETLRSIVEEYCVPIELLELELTENIVMEDLDRAEHVCQRLKDLGFRISIDDFGSGYSSLGTLQNLPIDVLKLDRTFLMSSESQERSKAILDGVVSIADKLNVSVVVEGVETCEQATMLVHMDERIIAQGFLYSRPVPRSISDQQFATGYLEPHEEA